MTCHLPCFRLSQWRMATFFPVWNKMSNGVKVCSQDISNKYLRFTKGCWCWFFLTGDSSKCNIILAKSDRNLFLTSAITATGAVRIAKLLTHLYWITIYSNPPGPLCLSTHHCCYSAFMTVQSFALSVEFWQHLMCHGSWFLEQC